jgi:hypothetical protein
LGKWQKGEEIIGLIPKSIFEKWKQYILKRDESKKEQLKEMFKVVEDKRRSPGFIT